MLVGNGAGLLTQTAGDLEIGTSATFIAGTVQINGGTLLADRTRRIVNASLVYDSSAASGYQGMLAGAGNSLIVNNENAMLTLSGSDTFGGGTTVAKWHTDPQRFGVAAGWIELDPWQRRYSRCSLCIAACGFAIAHRRATTRTGAGAGDDFNACHSRGRGSRLLETSPVNRRRTARRACLLL